MRQAARILVLFAVGGLGSIGCWYQRPPIEQWYKDIATGMDRHDVVKKLGGPTVVIENEMMYLYDDPDNPVRFRFVLDEEGVVVEKYLETKAELAKRTEEVKGELPPVEPIPGEENRAYPGGPLPRFEKGDEAERIK